MAKITVLGAGLVGGAMVRDLAARHEVLSTDFSAAALEPLAGLDSIVDTHNRDQHLVNMLLAWFCCDFKGRPSRLTEGRFTRTRSNNTLRLATGRKDFARKYLRRVVPSHWSGGEVRAWSELGALFSEELLAGDVAHLGAKGLQFRDPVRL